MSLEITAMLTKVIFESERGDFFVAEFVDCRSAKRFRASGDSLTTGKNQGQQKYRLFGEWKKSPKYGDTFAISYCEPLKPQSLAGLATFLANNVKGVGEKTAKKFVQHLQVSSMEELLRICKETPASIFGYFGKRRALAEAVISSLTGDEVYRTVMLFLHENNIPPHFARKIYEKYGGDAHRLLEENPYRLIKDFRNVGFKRADAIAQKLGVAGNSRFRVEACFLYVLERALDEGHCCLPRDRLVNRTVESLSADGSYSFEWVLSQLREIYRQQREEGEHSFVLREPDSASSLQQRAQILFYLPEVLEMERRVAHYCAERLDLSQVGEEHAEAQLLGDLQGLRAETPQIPWDTLSDEQHDAVLKSASERFMVLTGGPGCGKTFVLRAIHQLQKTLRRNVALCAPTGLAAKRMTQSIGSQAFTLHKLLGLGVRPTEEGGEPAPRGTEERLDLADTVICDESSMLSLDLFLSLLEAMAPHQRLILVGDVDQLPSVGAGQCLRDLIASGCVPVCRLTKIFRQKGSSPIPVAAQDIISGSVPEFDSVISRNEWSEKSDFVMVPSKAPDFFTKLIPFLKETVPSLYGLDPIKDAQILVPMRKSGVGQEEINRRLQEELNPPAESKNEVVVRNGLYRLREGDKVIQTRNNYDKEVFNGDLGTVLVVRVTGKKTEVDVQFQEKQVRLADEELEDLQLSYAMTIHKSQGSEFPLCVIPMFSAYYNMLYRNLLYTAVTRASRSVVIMGEDWALKRAIGNDDASLRHTSLAPLLNEILHARVEKHPQQAKPAAANATPSVS